MDIDPGAKKQETTHIYSVDALEFLHDSTFCDAWQRAEIAIRKPRDTTDIPGCIKQLEAELNAYFEGLGFMEASASASGTAYTAASGWSAARKLEELDCIFERVSIIPISNNHQAVFEIRSTEDTDKGVIYYMPFHASEELILHGFSLQEMKPSVQPLLEPLIDKMASDAVTRSRLMGFNTTEGRRLQAQTFTKRLEPWIHNNGWSVLIDTDNYFTESKYPQNPFEYVDQSRVNIFNNDERFTLIGGKVLGITFPDPMLDSRFPQISPDSDAINEPHLRVKDSYNRRFTISIESINAIYQLSTPDITDKK